MSEVIPSSHFNSGAGKGPEDRPHDWKKMREGLQHLKLTGKVTGKVKKIKGAKTTYTY